jgi:hypothetical protein
MGTLFRLDSISPSLTKAFQEASDGRRRQAARAACLVAIAQTGLHGSEVDAALGLLCHERNARSDTRSKLELLAAQLDEQYFRLAERADAITSEALATFRKARAAAALAFALSADSGQLHEAIYEAIAASSDQAEALRATETALTR